MKGEIDKLFDLAKSPQYDYGDDSWRRQTEETLNAHMSEEHLHPSNVAIFRVPRFDLGLALYRGFRLDDFAGDACVAIEEDDETLQRKIEMSGFSSELSVAEYRRIIAQTLVYMMQNELATVDLGRVEKLVPSAGSLKVDLEKDSNDSPFRPG